MGIGSYDYNEIVDAAALHRLTAAQHSSEENSVASPVRVNVTELNLELLHP